MSDLKPCPFCGESKAYIVYNIEMEPDGITCPTCHIVVRFPPEIIRCKECRFLEKDFYDRLHCTLYMDAHSPWVESRYEPEPDDFCSRAERREE